MTKNKNRGFIIFGTFLVDGAKTKKSTFRKFEKEAQLIAKKWIKADVEDVRIVPTSSLLYCEACNKVIEFEIVEEKRDDVDTKIKRCPVCKNEVHAP